MNCENVLMKVLTLVSGWDQSYQITLFLAALVLVYSFINMAINFVTRSLQLVVDGVTKALETAVALFRGWPGECDCDDDDDDDNDD
jgi:hypothetical protein